MTIETKELQNMTFSELKELKCRWYKQALEDGSLNRCYLVCTVLGKLLDDNYGPKYIYHNGGLELYVDDWGNYFTATWKGKQVMSTHPCTRLFIPGQWMDIVDRLYPPAASAREIKEHLTHEIERTNLIDELTIENEWR